MAIIFTNGIRIYYSITCRYTDGWWHRFAEVTFNLVGNYLDGCDGFLHQSDDLF
jgi:hypothetical protein